MRFGVPVACAFALLLLGGCSAGLKYVMDEYSGMQPHQVAMPDDTYRVFDKPQASRMMVTSSLSSAAAQGFGRGLVFGAIDTTPPKPLFEAAARAYLAETGRASCRITDAYILVQPQFEVRYDCTPQQAPPVVGAPAQRGRGQQAAAPVRPAPVAPIQPTPFEPEPVMSERDRVLMNMQR